MNNMYEKIIYLAGKYRGENRVETKGNVIKAEKMRNKLIKKGWAVLCPQKNDDGIELVKNKFQMVKKDWLNYDRTFLERCDAVVFIEGWKESMDATAEYKMAQDMDIEIYEFIENVPNLRKEVKL